MVWVLNDNAEQRTEDCECLQVQVLVKICDYTPEKLTRTLKMMVSIQ